MKVRSQIFASCSPDHFVGRTAELGRLLGHANGESKTNGLVLLAAPKVGTSEILRQTFDRLFQDQTDVIPFYFEIRPSDGDAYSAARRFLREFLLQTVAFRRTDRKILDSSPNIQEISELALPSDGHWIDRLIEILNSEHNLGDRSFITSCLSAPLRAAGHQARSFVMIDGLHSVADLSGGKTFIEDLTAVFEHSTTPFVFAGHRRFLFAKTPFETLPVEQFSFTETSKFIEGLAAKTGVAINDQTRDLVAVQFDGNVGAMTALFTSAVEKNAALDNFERVQNVYTDDLFGGRIGRHLDAVFDQILPETVIQDRVIKLLNKSLYAFEAKLPLDVWKKYIGLDAAELETVLDALHNAEIINVEPAAVKFDAVDKVVGDYVAARSKLAVVGSSRALIVGDTLAANIRRAPTLMARLYRKHSTIGLREILAAFDGQHISCNLIDYGRFNAGLKGADDENILKAVKDDNAKIALPRVVYTASASAFYPQLTEIAEPERIAVAMGTDTDAREIVVIAAEVESKLEATRELAEFWCDRLEMAALHCNFTNFKLWLVAPEGFTTEALEALKNRNAHGSSRKQVVLLSQILNTGSAAMAEKTADEYEITVPMGDDTEMIAAHTIEDIAKRHNFPTKAINQIKTALVEACINAAEHSLSPDRKIYQKFAVDDEKVVITVANRGLRLIDKNAVEIIPSEGRRGWGLKLMKGLMDEVHIEQSDDGTRITMTKFINSPAKAAVVPA